MKSKITITLPVALMASLGCVDGCDPNDLVFPAYLPDPCAAFVRAGGIKGIFFKRCDVEFDITVQSEWETEIANGTVRGRLNGRKIRGSLGAADRTKKRRGACGNEETTKKTLTVTVFDTESDADYSIVDLYDYLEKQGDKYDVAFQTCDNSFFGWFKDAVIEIDPIIPETDDDDYEHQIVFQFNTGKGVIKPVQIDFLEDLNPGLNGV